VRFRHRSRTEKQLARSGRESLVLVPLAIHDLIVSRRVHPVTLIGSGVVLVCHAAVIAFSLAGEQGWRLWLQGITEGLR
jgi:hypothetical protein